MTRPTLFDVIRDIRTTSQGLAETNPEALEDITAFLDTLEGESDAMEIADRFARRYREAVTLAEAAKKEVEFVTARKKRFEARAASDKALLAMIVDAIMPPAANNTGKRAALVRPGFTASFRAAGDGRLVIEDAEKIPLEYLEYPSPVPRNSDIKEALVNGENVPGAKLEGGEPSFSVSLR